MAVVTLCSCRLERMVLEGAKKIVEGVGRYRISVKSRNRALMRTLHTKASAQSSSGTSGCPPEVPAV